MVPASVVKLNPGVVQVGGSCADFIACGGELVVPHLMENRIRP